MSGAVQVLNACRSDVLPTADGRGGNRCGAYLVTPDRVGTVEPDDGGLHWRAGLRPPNGTVDRIIKDGDRVIMVTAPTRVLPDAKGALVVDRYFGTLRPSRRLAPGEYPVTDGTMNEIIRAPGRPDRLLYAGADLPVRPHGLSPATRSLTNDFWQDGRRLLLLDHQGTTLWRAHRTARRSGTPTKASAARSPTATATIW